MHAVPAMEVVEEKYVPTVDDILLVQKKAALTQLRPRIIGDGYEYVRGRGRVMLYQEWNISKLLLEDIKRRGTEWVIVVWGIY